MSAAFLLKLRSIQGKSRAFMLALCGALTVLALPPLHILPAGAVGVSLFFLVAFTGECTAKKGFKDGLAFGYGFFLAGLYWISIALTVEIERFFWLIPVAILGIPLVMCLYMGICGALCGAACRLYKGFNGRAAIFGLSWLIAEYIRGVAFGGFPWNLLGYSLTPYLTLLQTASIGGIWLLSVLVLVMFLTPAIIVGLFASQSSVMGGVAAIVIACASITLSYNYGAKRLDAHEASTVPGVKLRIVQPNIAQNVKWDPKKRYENLQLLAELSKTTDPEVKYVVWPESALPYMIADNMQTAELMGESAPPGGGVISGAVRGRFNEDGRIQQVWNSIVVVNEKGALTQYYDKSHLVPFGEYVPLRRFFPFISKLTEGMVDFSPGEGIQTLNLPGLPPFSPLVCYEIIFPGNVATEGAERPHMLLNVTNDAWYGKSSGPYQHFAAAIVRAVEEGVPVVRAANNGISAVIDPLGRVKERTDLGTRGVMDVALPAALDELPIFAKITR